MAHDDHHRRRHALQRADESPGIRAPRFFTPEARRRRRHAAAAEHRGRNGAPSRGGRSPKDTVSRKLHRSSPAICYDAPRIGSRRTAAALHGNQHPGRRKEVPIGEAGEFCVRGPQVMRGYWNRDAETADVTIAGRLAAHRRHRRHGRRGLPAHRRPQEGHDHRVRLQGLSERNRKRRRRAPGGGSNAAASVCRTRIPGRSSRCSSSCATSTSVTVEELREHFSAAAHRTTSGRSIWSFAQSLPKTNIGKILRRELMREESTRAA